METIKNFIFDKPEWLFLYFILIICTGIIWSKLDHFLFEMKDFLRYTNGLIQEIKDTIGLLENDVDDIKKGF